VNKFLDLELLDELHIAEIPVELKTGELLLTDPQTQLRNYQALEPIVSENIIHRRYLRR
jgi:dihydrofolate reductase